MSNFSFLSPDWPVLNELAELAERNLQIDPNTSLIKLRMFAETLTKYLSAYEKMEDAADGYQVARINLLGNSGVMPDRLLPLFHSLRKVGNKATHEVYGTTESAQTHLQFAYRLSVWFRQTYGKGDFTPQDFVLPQESFPDAQHLLALNEELQQRSLKLEDDYDKLQAELEKLRVIEATAESKSTRRKVSTNIANQMNLSEAETRLLIDEQLNAVGWLTDSQIIRYAKGARPEKGVNKAIAEWPTSSGPADYALFVGLDLIAIVEAKKKAKDVVLIFARQSGMLQASKLRVKESL